MPSLIGLAQKNRPIRKCISDYYFLRTSLKLVKRLMTHFTNRQTPDASKDFDV